MYFTNVSNKELQRFHHVVKNNFSINLVDVENNPLFYYQPENKIVLSDGKKVDKNLR